MWFNSMVNEAPHQGLKPCRRYAERSIFPVFNRDGRAGAARLSSARGLSCSLKWVNERNPHSVLQVSQETAPFSGRKAGMTSNQRGPLISWATHMLQWFVQWVAKPKGGANPTKRNLSSDWRLQLASMKLESLVIADQNAAVNTLSSLVLTARHTRGAGDR